MKKLTAIIAALVISTPVFASTSGPVNGESNLQINEEYSFQVEVSQKDPAQLAAEQKEIRDASSSTFDSFAENEEYDLTVDVARKDPDSLASERKELIDAPLTHTYEG